MSRRFLAVIAAAATVALASPATALADVPVHVRVIRGSRNGPAKIDPRLENLRRQLSPLAYIKWEQLSEQELRMQKGKTEFVTLPDGEHVALTMLDERGKSVTFEVALASRNTQSRLTVEKGQRIVHQVTGEKAGAAYFFTVIAGP